MYNTRNLAFVFAAVLIFFIAAANLAQITTTSVKADSRPAIGMGDLRYLEGQLSRYTNVIADSSHKAVGIGDLRRFEAQFIRSSEALVTSSSKKGIGDLRRFENQPPANIQSNPGMGDLRRFEAHRY